MMICKKKGIIFLGLVLLCQIFLVGCTEEASVPADEVAMDICRLLVSDDASAYKESMGLTDNDIQKMQDIMWYQFNKSFKDSLSKMHFYKPTEKDARALYLVMFESLKRLNYTTELGPAISNDNASAIVTVKINSFDMSGITVKAAEKAMDQLGNIQLSEEETATKYVKLYIKYISKLIQDTEPSQEQSTLIVDFIKVKAEVNGKIKEVWIPKDSYKFGEDLVKKAYGGLL